MVIFFLTKKSSFCIFGFSSRAPQSTCFGELKNMAGVVDGKIRVGRQIGFVESSLSSDEEEEVARGEMWTTRLIEVARLRSTYNRLSLISSSGSSIARLAEKIFYGWQKILQLDSQRDIATRAL